MTAILPRLFMAFAVACFGPHRQGWASAMLAEFELAEDEGRAFSFSLGCIWAAWREIPFYHEGRMRVMRYGMALALILPMASLLLVGAIQGYPYTELAFSTSLQAGVASTLFNDGNRTSAPILTLLISGLAACNILAAWFLVERDRERGVVL
jgi:hypothetical protein